MQLVDSHCHINFDALSHDTEGVLARARDNGVDYLLCVAVNLEDYPQIEKLSASHANIFASVGVHPNATDCHDPSAEELIELAANPNVVAIGETDSRPGGLTPARLSAEKMFTVYDKVGFYRKIARDQLNEQLTLEEITLTLQYAIKG